MTTYARIAGGQATDVSTTNPWLIFHPQLAATFFIVPDETYNGQPMTEDGLTPAPKPEGYQEPPGPVTQGTGAGGGEQRPPST